MQKIKLFANYSIPVIWGVVGLVVGCVAFYLPALHLWEHIIVKPENITPTDGLTVIILSVIAGIFHRRRRAFRLRAEPLDRPPLNAQPQIIAATCLDTPRSLPVN